MKLLRLFLLACLAIASVLIPMSLNAQTDAQNFGVKLGYVSKNHSMIFGAFYQYPVNDQVRIAPEVGYIFRNRNLSAFNADLNFHFPLHILSGQNCLYPIGGIDFTTWRLHDIPQIQYGEVSKTYSRLGVNLGAGFEYYTSRNLKLKVEWKYTLTSKYSTMVLDAGVGYFF